MYPVAAIGHRHELGVRELRRFRLSRVDCIYVDLPMSHPGTADLGNALRNRGFFFGAVLPGLNGDDVLRLQFLNNVPVDPNDISVASDHGRDVLDAILRDRAENE